MTQHAACNKDNVGVGSWFDQARHVRFKKVLAARRHVDCEKQSLLIKITGQIIGMLVYQVLDYCTFTVLNSLNVINLSYANSFFNDAFNVYQYFFHSIGLFLVLSSQNVHLIITN